MKCENSTPKKISMRNEFEICFKRRNICRIRSSKASSTSLSRKSNRLKLKNNSKSVKNTTNSSPPIQEKHYRNKTPRKLNKNSSKLKSINLLRKKRTKLRSSKAIRTFFLVEFLAYTSK